MLGKTVQFNLKDDLIVTLEMTPRLVEDIVRAFELKGPDEMTTTHVKYYLASGMKKALEASDVKE